MSAVLWQRLEGALVLAAALALLAPAAGLPPHGLPWWALLALFFAPDLGFLGYLAGPRAGAAAYNALHLYGVGLALCALGLAGAGPPVLVAAGLLWTAHAGFDRMLGYGLKEPTGFGDTHLGRIGRR